MVDRPGPSRRSPGGLDLSERQLEHARTLIAEARVAFPLVHASAERVPLPDESFDIVFCDHGAMTFADPYLTVPEVARLLRPGGLFAFSHGSPILSITWPADAERARDRLVADYFGMHRFEYADSIDFNLPYRMDPALPRERLHRRGPDRAATGVRCDEHVPRRT